MKKTALTLVAVAFGSCVAFAQTTPQTDETVTTDTEQTLTIDRMSDTPAEAGRRDIKVEELPAAVQEQLASGEFASLQVVTVAEVQPQADDETGAVQYEVALQDNTADAAAEPSLVVYFDEQGQLLSSNQPAVEEEVEATEETETEVEAETETEVEEVEGEAEVEVDSEVEGEVEAEEVE